VKKAQQVMQVEAVKVQKELAACVPSLGDSQVLCSPAWLQRRV